MERVHDDRIMNFIANLSEYRIANVCGYLKCGEHEAVVDIVMTEFGFDKTVTRQRVESLVDTSEGLGTL